MNLPNNSVHPQVEDHLLPWPSRSHATLTSYSTIIDTKSMFTTPPALTGVDYELSPPAHIGKPAWSPWLQITLATVVTLVALCLLPAAVRRTQRLPSAIRDAVLTWLGNNALLEQALKAEREERYDPALTSMKEKVEGLAALVDKMQKHMVEDGGFARRTMEAVT